MKLEIELPYFNLEKAFEKATEQAIDKIEDEAYENNDQRSVCNLLTIHTGTTYRLDKYGSSSCYIFSFEISEPYRN